MHRTIRKILLVLLALIFLGSIARVAYQALQYRQGDETYAQAETLANLPDLSGLSELPDLSAPKPNSGDGSAAPPSAATSAAPAPVYVDPYADVLRNMDFTALREVNDEILGWILIPDTQLSYPLVQGKDNSYYLNHTWRHSRNSVGAIFLEHKNHSDLSDFNTIIYGHRMNNNAMFGSLKYYKDQSYWAAHPNIYITDDSGSHQYEIFSAYEVSVEGDAYRLGFSGDQSKQLFLDYCAAQSVLDTGIVPTIYDRVLTLSTCTGSGHATRWVIQAVLRGVVPSDAAQQAAKDGAADPGSSLPPAEPPLLPEAVPPTPTPPLQEADPADSPVSQDIRRD